MITGNSFLASMSIREETYVRKKDDTLRDTLLDLVHALVETGNPDAVNIRGIAKKAGIATGTVYNYFSNKDELLLAATERYWRNTLLEMHTAITAVSFCGQLEEIYAFLQSRIAGSAGQLMRSLGSAESAGQECMVHMQAALESTLARRMEQDPKVRGDIWNETFTKEQYARFLMQNLILLLRTQTPDIHFFLEIVRRTIYE